MKPRYLTPGIYTADPSAHVFNGRIYIYPSHDIESGIPENDLGDHFDMRDYHIFSMDDVDGEVTDHGVALDVKNIPWAGRQLWAPDVACKNGKYYLYFPLKDQNDIFRIGVAVSDKPEGPFVPQPDPIKSSHSIDPAVLEDNDGKYYIERHKKFQQPFIINTAGDDTGSHTGQPAAPDTQRHGHHHQQGDHNQRSTYFWKNEIGFCFDAHYFQRIYLLTYPHIAQLAGNFTPYHTGQYNTNQGGCKFQYHRIPYNLSNG